MWNANHFLNCEFQFTWFLHFYRLNNASISFHLFHFRGKTVADAGPESDAGQPNPKISYSPLKESDHQEKTDKNELSIIDDCDLVPPTVILNQQLIVDYKYAYFHHEDVQENPNSFLKENSLEPTVLCIGIGCNEIET